MKIISANGLVAGCCSLVIGGGCLSCSTTKKTERPNILFILSDDHTSQAWGIYGGVLAPYVQNSHIARLAREGCVLDNCFCSNSISVPSRATILTGQYSHRNGVYTLEDALEPDSANIAKVLSSNGYQTALIGKWHLRKRPAGFGHFDVFYDQGVYWNPDFFSEKNWNEKGIGGEKTEGFSTDIVTDRTISWLEGRDKTKPFFMCCHFKATHEPFDFPERLRHLYDGVQFPEPETLLEFGPEASGRTFSGRQLENLGWRWEYATRDPEGWWCKYPELPFSTQGLDSVAARRKIYQKMVRDYLRCGAAIDDNIGRLLKYLDESGLSENTIVVYVSDQGYFLGEHGFFDKRLIYEESMRMPFVIRYPKEIPSGTRNRDLIGNIDFAALFADYAGIERPAFVQGRSFRENLKGKTPQDWRKSVYYRYWLHDPIRPAHFGIRNERYKLAFFYGQPLDKTGTVKRATEPAWEFYDLQKDPAENKNLYGDAGYAEIIDRMKNDLLKIKAEAGDDDGIYPEMEEVLNRFCWK